MQKTFFGVFVLTIILLCNGNFIFHRYEVQSNQCHIESVLELQNDDVQMRSDDAVVFRTSFDYILPQPVNLVLPQNEFHIWKPPVNS